MAVAAPARPVTPTPPSAPPPRAAARRAWRAALAASASNLIVFGLLAGVMFYGHQNGWKLPKASALLGAPAAAADDWCSEHLVPESQCIECQAALAPKAPSFGFCQEHGVAECVIHHPELAQVKGAPRPPQYDTVAAIAVKDRPRNNSRETLHTRRVQFTSTESVAKAGVDVGVVQEAPMMDFVAANGELRFDPTRVAHLSTRVPGVVAAVFKTVGDRVEAGETLALIDAAQVGEAKARLLQAAVQLQLKKATVERLRGLSGGTVPQKSLLEAEAARQESEAAFASARQSLSNLGFAVPDGLESQTLEAISAALRSLDVPTSLASSYAGGSTTANLIPVRATYSGTVVASQLVAGEVVDAAKTLFTVADPSRLWLLCHVRQEDAKYLALELPVRFRTDGGAQEAAGLISWISPTVDERTRTLQVRALVANADGKLRDNTFGSAKIVLRDEPNAVVVPREAVQATADARFVFVRDKNYFTAGAPKFFHVRQVRVGAQDGDRVELLAGVLPGEVIVTKGSSVLLAQLLRSSLGAGCGCHEQH
ncbi:MAG TPA: efflux RND transporter periplasmic adaptor subunit [Pirellulales bacterium]